MKKLLNTLVFMAVLPILGNSQNDASLIVHNFILKNGEIFWQKTFDIDSATCNQYFKEKPFVNKEECFITLANYSPQKYMNRAFLLNEPCTITFSLQAKEDRYRITISNIVFESSTSVGVALGSGIAIGETTKNYYDLKFYAYNKKGKIKFKEGGIIPKQFDEELTQLFDATKNQHGEEHTNILNSDF